jgi:hypothetical protein
MMPPAASDQTCAGTSDDRQHRPPTEAVVIHEMKTVTVIDNPQNCFPSYSSVGSRIPP